MAKNDLLTCLCVTMKNWWKIQVVRGLIQEASEQLDMCKVYDGTRNINPKGPVENFLPWKLEDGA